MVGPRVQFDVNHYPRIREWCSESGADRVLYLHRLVAYAHGELDSPWDAREVHHVDGDGWNNRPANLVAVEPGRHSRITRRESV